MQFSLEQLEDRHQPRPRSRVGRSVCLLLALLCFCHVHADDLHGWSNFTNDAFRHFTAEDGLPNPAVTAIAEDGNGFLWIGTQGGVARWDGYRFKSFKPVRGDATTLPDGWIITMHTDTTGRLWIGTSAGGLVRYDGALDRFVTYSANQHGLSHVRVSDIADDGADALWIATEAGLDHMDTVSGRIDTLHPIAGDSGSLPDDRITAVLVDQHATLWVGTRHGLARRDKGADHFDRIPLGDVEADPVVVTHLLEDASGNLWIGTHKEGAFVIPPQGDRRKPERAAGNQNDEMAHEWIYSMGADSAGGVWLGTYGHGIVVVDREHNTLRRLRHDPLRQQSLADDTIWSLHRDRTGTIWVGTTAGLSRMTSSQTGAILTVAPKSNDRPGLSEGAVVSLTQAADGRLWAGLHGKGIDIVDLEHGLIDNIAPGHLATMTALSDTPVASLQEGLADDMYAGTNRGIFHIAQRDHAVQRLSIPGRDPLAQNHGLKMISGKLWIAGGEDGVWVIAPEGAPAAPVEHFDEDRLTDRRTTTFALGTAGELWIGTRNGLNRMDLATRAVQRIYPEAGNPDALGAGYIACLLIDREKRLWVGTFGAGVQILEQTQSARPVFRRITTVQGLPDDNIDTLVADRDGRIWAATDNGVAVIDPANFQVRTFNRADGVSISAYWGNSGLLTKTGEVVFGGASGGMTVIRPGALRGWDYRPPLVVTEALVGGVHVPTGRFNGAGQASDLIVQSNANSLSVEFAALDYSSPERNRYQYQLEGYDEAWINSSSTHRAAVYTNLPPGDYKLHLRGSNREGAWSERTLDLPIRVLPAWYQTVWVRILLAVTAIAAVLALVQGRTIVLRRRQRELEYLVTQRTEQLGIALKTAESAAQAKSEFLANMSHEIRTPMNGVVGMLDLLKTEEMRPDAHSMLEIARGSADALLTIINDILDFSKIEAGKLTLEAVDCELRTLAEDVASLFAQQANLKGIELICAVHNDVPELVRGDPTRLRQILINLMGNSIKFTERGEVLLEIKMAPDGGAAPGDDAAVRPGNIQIFVRDSGIGMSAEAQDTLFTAFTQADSSTTRKYGGTGLGLAITKRLIDAMGGTIEVDSRVGRGTTFCVRLNLEAQSPIAAPLPRIPTPFRVLIIDDNPANLWITEHYLRPLRIVCETAASGALGLDAIRCASRDGAPYDLILVDSQMPAMTGMEFIHECRRDPATAAVRCVLMRALGDRTAAGDDADPATCLAKPLRKKQLTALVTQAAIGADMAPTIGPATRTTVLYPTARVLLAEDNRVNQEVALRMLKTFGINPRVAPDGEVALTLLRSECFDLVLMDCQMPVMDGYVASRAIRSWEAARSGEMQPQPRLPIVAMTANALVGDRELCIAAGMDDYVTKPLKQKTLGCVLARWLVPATESGAGVQQTTWKDRVSGTPGHSANHAIEAPAATEPVLDTRVLDELRELMGPDFASTLECYLADTPVQLHSMQAAITNGDHATVERCAHSLKATSDTVGAGRLKSTAEKIEAHARDRRDCIDATILAAAAIASFEALKPQIQALIARERPGISAGAAARA